MHFMLKNPERLVEITISLFPFTLQNLYYSLRKR